MTTATDHGERDALERDAWAPDPNWIPDSAEMADNIVRRWTEGKLDALRRERGFDDEVETTRKFVVTTIPEYADRFLLELIQNAHDALPPSGDGRVAIILDTRSPEAPELLVANTGIPFRYRDFRSLSRMAQSEKAPGQGIGHKGVGFKSVLQVAPQPQIFSASRSQDGSGFTGFRFTFPDSDAYELLIPPDSGLPRMTPYSLPVPIPLEDQPPSVRALAAEGYVTAIRLPMRPSATATVQRALDEVVAGDAPILLFLDRIRELTVIRRTNEGEEADRLERRTSRLATGTGSFVSSLDLGERGRYLLVQGQVDESPFLDAIRADIAVSLVDEQWEDWSGPAPIAIALPLDRQAKDDRLYCFLPLAAGAVSPLAGHVHAPFAVGLARRGLVQGSAINDLLLDEIAGLCVAATHLIEDPNLGAAVVDLVAWPRERSRITSAWQRAGATLSEAKLIPVIGSHDRAAFSEVSYFDPPGALQFTPDAVVRAAAAKLLDPRVGPRRTQALTSFALEALGIDLLPAEAMRASWAESLARRLPRRGLTQGDLTAWLEFYDDLPKVFEGDSGRSLAGKAIVLGEDEQLLETWSEAPIKKRRRVRGVFFPSREGEAGDGDTWDGPVPRSLRGSITRVHPKLDWYIPGDAIRRNRPGRMFLEQQGLVRVHRTEDLVRLVERVLHSARRPTVWSDALLFVYRLTRPGPRRPDLKAFNLQRLKFRVFASSGWIAADSAYFSGGWTLSGADLEVLTRSSGEASSELAALSTLMLRPPAAWVPKSVNIEDWTELLRLCGVRDGLHPQVIGVADRVIAGSGSRWSGAERLADDLGLTGRSRDAWLESVALGDWPRHEGAEYIASNPAHRLPGQDDFLALPDDARHAYARLSVRQIGQWGDDVFEVEIHRRWSGGGDSKTVPTPAGIFLTRTPWLPASRPGSRGEEDWVSPADAWFVGAREREPYFAPILLPEVRSLLTDGSSSLAALRRLGAHEWSSPQDAGARVALMGRLLRDGMVLPGFHSQIRNVVEDAWRWLIELGAEGPKLPALDVLVVTRGSRLETVSPATPCYVLANADRMLELVLSSLEEPVLVAPAELGPQVLARLAEVTGSARLIWPADLQVEVDGVPVTSATGGAERLTDAPRGWLFNLVFLTLVLRQTGLRIVTPNVIDAALDRLAQIRLVRASEISLRLEGLRREVPAYSRGVVPVSIDGVRAIAWVPDGDGFGWAALRRLVPAIADLIGERWARDALENVVRALGDGQDVLQEPDDEAYAEAFGVTQARIDELLRGQRQVADQALDRLLPALAYFVGIDAARLACRSAAGQADVDMALELALSEWRSPETEFDPDEVAEAARTSRGFLAVRDRLGLDFGRFNGILAGLGGQYFPELHGPAHAQVMWSYVASKREAIGDALRAMEMSTAGGTSIVPDAYLKAISLLDLAVAGPSEPDRDAPLAADPAWQIEYREPPSALIEARINAWLSGLGAPPLGSSTGLPAITAMRETNGRRLRDVLSRQALVVLAWLGRRGRDDVPAWTGDPDNAAAAVAASGRLDFGPLQDDELLRQASSQLPWPDGLQATLDLAAIGLTDEDVAMFQNEAERRQHIASRERRGVDIAGRVVTLDADSIEGDLAYVISTIDPEMLNRSPSEVELGAPPKSRDSRRPHWSPARGRGRPSREKLEATGLVGEAIAYAWLCRHYTAEHVAWMSTNRTYHFHDGDPGNDACGYDFHVTAGRNPIFIEVKTSTGDPGQFELTEGEVDFARSKARTSTYRVLYIANVGVPEARLMLLLPNPLSPRAKDRYRAISTGSKFAFTRPSS